MNLSDKLAALNVARYQAWETPFSARSARQSIYAFRGDVYIGLEADSMNGHDLNYAQNHLRILSGLHGVLRPLDLIQAHRLEMGTSLKNSNGKDLYAFWRTIVTRSLNDEIKNSRTLVVNLASQEYFKAVDTSILDGKLITPLFKDYKSGEYRVIGFWAKKARGRMARYLIDERVKTLAGLKRFTGDGYRFNRDLSADGELVFTRDNPPSA